VISGEIAAVERACVLAREHGAKRAIRLEVSGAFHSPLMESAARGLAESLDATPFRDARCPVVTNVAAQPVTRAADLRDALERQLLGAVRWEDSMRWLATQEPDAFVEVGTGRVLRGLLRSVAPGARALGVDDPDSLVATLAALGVVPAGGVAS
jgi:[acyl-carrier-protein] S-malonyltransferase